MGSRWMSACTGVLATGGTSRKCIYSFRMPEADDGDGDLAEISCSVTGATAEVFLELEQQLDGHGSGGSVVTPREIGFPGAPAALGTAKKNYTSNPPAAGEVIWAEYTKSGYTWRFGSETKPGTTFCIYATAAADHGISARSVWREKA